jgi:hypothetical protein
MQNKTHIRPNARTGCETPIAAYRHTPEETKIAELWEPSDNIVLGCVKKQNKLETLVPFVHWKLSRTTCQASARFLSAAHTRKQSTRLGAKNLKPTDGYPNWRRKDNDAMIACKVSLFPPRPILFSFVVRLIVLT